MTYRTLEKALHADWSSERFSRHDDLYRQRFMSESTFRTGIQLDMGELFLGVPRELSVLNEQVLRRERRVSALWRSLPTVALGAFIRSLIMDEVVYSNEIEGVHSTRREIEMALDQAQRGSSSLKGAASKEHAPFIEFAKLYLGLTENPRLPQTLQDIRDIYDAVVDADALLLITEWKVFRMPSWQAVKKLMANPLVIDGRNIYDPQEMQEYGFEYHCIGR